MEDLMSRTYIATRLSDGTWIVDIFAINTNPDVGNILYNHKEREDCLIGHLKFPAQYCKTLAEAEELARRVDMLNDSAKQERLKTQGRLF
jgi:hypothetical protein